MKINGRLVVFSESPNHSSREGAVPKVIVLHSTGGGYAGAVAWLKNPDSKVSAHYVVAKDGRITQLVDTSESAWHAGTSKWKGHNDVNKIAIGIEMEHFDGRDEWDKRQLKSVVELCKMLKTKWSIPVIDIVGHNNVCVPAGRKIDPKDFPWREFREMF